MKSLAACRRIRIGCARATVLACVLACVLASVLACVAAGALSAQADQSSLKYPATARSAQSD
ncbi:MAG: hypothetical protein ABJF01_11135, partial [bacterium]